MLVVGIIVTGIILALLVIGSYYNEEYDRALIWLVMTIGAVVIGLIEIVMIICLPFCISNCVTLSTCDKKIAMYQEENENIQSQINQIISNYMEYEQNTYSNAIKEIDLNNTDIVVLTQLYPDLKSNEMVNNQINIYQENNKKIKELKEEKINKQISKWWLYFGSVD